MEFFVRLQEGLANVGSVVPLEEYTNISKLKEHIKTGPGSDWYTSLFYYPKDIKDLFDKTGSVSGYKGPAFSNFLVWDFDSKHDVNLAKEDVRTLLNRLKDKIPEVAKYVSVYFSGNKGFHVYLKTNKQFSPEEMKHACSVLADGLDSFDSVIYNSTRVFRIQNTKNQKSGLYKVLIEPKTLKEPNLLEGLRALAKNPGVWQNDPAILEDCLFIDEILAAKPEKRSSVILDEDIEEIDGVRGLNTVDLRKASDMPKCIYALSQGIMKSGDGQRNHIFLHLANYYRNKGFDKEVVHNILKGISRLNKALYPEFDEFPKEEIWNTAIRRSFSTENTINPGGWGIKADDMIFASYCKMLSGSCRCPIHDTVKVKKSVIKITEVAKDFGNFATNFHDNIVTSGIKFIDDNMKIATGTTTLLVGAAGSGKTTLCLNMLEHTNKENYASMFFSMDMHKNLLYLKLAQRHTRWKQDEIFKAFKGNDKKIIDEINERINENYGETFFDFSGSLNLDDIKQRIQVTEQENSKKVKLVIIDYASRIKGPFSDANANEKHNALASKDAADETDAAWIILNQVSRATGDGSSPIRTKRAAKGSGDWEETASNVITVWRPFMGLHDVVDPETNMVFYDQFMRVFLAKNRMGSEVEDVLLWDGAGGLVRDMTREEKDRFETEEKKKEKPARIYKTNNK